MFPQNYNLSFISHSDFQILNLIRFMEESMFWYTTQKDYVTAVLSLTKIARFNGIVFEDIFREARDFLRGKRSKGIQCDFQPLLRLGLFYIFNIFCSIKFF
jgi:hypothetical protein